jgi:hypothetical protein
VFDCPDPVLIPIIVVLDALQDAINAAAFPDELPTYTLLLSSPIFSVVTLSELAVMLSIFRILNVVPNPFKEL